MIEHDNSRLARRCAASSGEQRADGAARQLARRRRRPRAATCPRTSTTSRRSCATLPAASRVLLRRPGLQPAGARRRASRHGGADARRAAEHPSSTTACVYAEAGVASPKVARFAATHDLAGAEFLAGIPGTVGGALAMNAGCYGGETWDIVERVLTIDRQRRGARARARASSRSATATCALQGRRRLGADEWFAGAWFRFAPGRRRGRARARIKELLEKRIATQPLALPNAGLGVPQPARRPRGAADRVLRAEGLRDRRRARVREARQLHRQSRAARRAPPTSRR